MSTPLNVEGVQVAHAGSSSARASRARPHLDAVVELNGAGPRPVLVAVHGIGRGHSAQARAWRAFARSRGMHLLAPHFEQARHADYQRMGRLGRGERADLALLGLLDELVEAGHAEPAVHLVGYSGGGQFAHRFALAWPERVKSVTAVAAGWYTPPDAAARYPHGLRATSRLPGVRFDLAAALEIPMLAIVGDRDVERDEGLRTGGRVAAQGVHRVERARRWVEVMNAAAIARGLSPLARFEALPGAGHSVDACVEAGLVERVARFVDAVNDAGSEVGQ